MNIHSKLNTMKKLIILLTLALVMVLPFVTVQDSHSQGTIVNAFALPSDSVVGLNNVLTVFSPLLDEYWDVSIQFKSTFTNSGGASSGDSSYWSFKVFQTNDASKSVWTEITSARDTLNTATDVQGLIYEIDDFKGMWQKYTLTGISVDTVLIVPYFVEKQKRNRFF